MCKFLRVNRNFPVIRLFRRPITTQPAENLETSSGIRLYLPLRLRVRQAIAREGREREIGEREGRGWGKFR